MVEENEDASCRVWEHYSYKQDVVSKSPFLVLKVIEFSSNSTLYPLFIAKILLTV